MTAISYVSNPFDSIFHHGLRISPILTDSDPMPHVGAQQILTFFSIVESICLYDKVYFSYLPRDGGYLWQLENTDPILARGQADGFIEFEFSEDIAAKTIPFKTVEDFPDEFKDFIEFTTDNFLFLANSYMIFRCKEEVLPLSNGVFDPISPIYSSIASGILSDRGMYFSQQDKEFFSLYSNNEQKKSQSIVEHIYMCLTNGLEGDIENIKIFDQSITVSIPPFTALVLDRCSGISDLADAVVSVREDFKPLRAIFGDYQSVIDYPGSTLKQRLKIRNMFTSYGEQLSKSYEFWDGASISEWSNLTGLIDYEKLTEGKLIGAIIGKPTKAFMEAKRKRKIRQFLLVREKYLAIKDYGRLFENKLGIDLAPYSSHIEKLSIKP